MSTKDVKIGLSKGNANQIIGAIATGVLNRLVTQFSTSVAYTKGQYTNYQNVLYRFTADKSAGAWDSTKVETASFNELVDDVNSAVASVTGKANTQDLLNGTLVPNKALSAIGIQPVSEDSGTAQENPFINQGAGTNNNVESVDTSPVGKNLEKQGNTICYNQFAKELNSTNWAKASKCSVSFNNGKATLTADENFAGYGQELYTKYSIKVINGHKYLAYLQIDESSDFNTLTVRGYGTNSSIFGTITKTNPFTIITADASDSKTLAIGYYGAYTSGQSFTVSNLLLIDLTQWFNGDIPQDLLDNPDHLSWYYNGDLSYNTGELKNAVGRYLQCGQSRNEWDEIAEQGTLNNGANESNSGKLRSKNYIRVIPNKEYAINNAYIQQVAMYDKDKVFIGNVDSFVSKTGYRTFVVASNCQYIRFATSSAYPMPYNNDITISEYYASGDSYDQYFTYEEPKVYDTGTEVLRRIPVAGGDDIFDTKLPDGTITRRVGYIDLGTLDWVYGGSEGHEGFTSVTAPTNIKLPASSSVLANGFCSKYQVTSGDKRYLHSIDGCVAVYYVNGRIEFYSSTMGSDPATFKTSMSGVYLFYELATPTTEQGTPFAENIEINDYSYMLWLDTSNNLVDIPQGVKIFYPADYVNAIDTINNLAKGDMNNLFYKNKDYVCAL